MFLIQELKEGRQIGRAELYIATHTKKMDSQLMITALKKLYVAFFLQLVY
jgi:hypothetical protein